MNELEVRAYAKINLGLDVVRRLENGYHEVRMIMQTIDLFDTLTLHKTTGEISLKTDSTEIPMDEDNLVCKAARLFMEETKTEGGIAIHLTKRIPVAAGLAGGSTDAAAVLQGLNTLYGTGLSKEQLCAMGVKLGADVPYCIMGGTAIAEGIGEVLTKLPDAPPMHLLLAKPDIAVSTKYVYENLRLSKLSTHPDIEGIAEAIRKGDREGILCRMDNVLQSVTEKKYPIVTKIKEFMEENGARKALMSGSGPTVFGIYDSKEAALLAKEKLSEQVSQVFVTTFR